MLFVDNYEDIRFTKVKSYVVHFHYKGKHYMLHQNEEYYGVALYVFKDGKPNYIIRSSITSIGEIVKFMFKGRVYSQIDKLGFVVKLHHYGLIKSKYYYEVKKYEKIKEVKSHLLSLSRKL